MLTFERKHMNLENNNSVNREQQARVFSGWLMLPVVLLLILGSPAVFIYSIASGVSKFGHPDWMLFVPALLLEAVGIVLACGFFTLQPNEARVLILFGAYKGTVGRADSTGAIHFSQMAIAPARWPLNGGNARKAGGRKREPVATGRPPAAGNRRATRFPCERGR